MRQRPWALLPALIAGLLCLGATAWSQADSSGQEKIIFIGWLDPDCHADTVRGVKTARGYLPKRILWGLPAADQFGKPDTACLGRTPLNKRVRQTIIAYNGGAYAHDGAVAFQQVNPDTLVDIVIHVHQTFKEKEAERDSLRSIVIFGQHTLNAVPVIHVGDIRRFQVAPFFAMELVKGSELTRPATRDLSGNTSYILEPVDIAIDDRDSVAHPIVAPLAGADYHDAARKGATVQIYPNPAKDAVVIEAAGLRAGNYVIELVSVNGAVELREEVGVGAGEPLARTLDVRRTPTGYYVVRIESGDSSPGAGAAIATYPIIITR